MNVAVIGSGGREHALCHALHKSDRLNQLFAIPGNPGMSTIATCIDINPMNITTLINVCKEHQIELVIPGSEVYLEAGITDQLTQVGIQVFGPTKQASKVESSKEFAKDIMHKYKIPTAHYQVFTSYANAWEYVNQQGVPIVIKYDGLAGGKGVVVAMTLDQAKQALQDMLVDHLYGTDPVIIEEYLEGPEFSLMCFVHNNTVIPMPIAQDHKRLLDGDKGPNTGGMGIYSSVPIISNDIMEEAMNTIMKPMANALLKENVPYTGFLYGGLMETTNGPKVIEFNARFGDPEAEVILPKLESDIIYIIQSLLEDKPVVIRWSNDFVVGVVLASSGYPLAYQKGYPIHNLEDVSDLVFHMGTTIKDNQIVTNGGRVLLVTGRASSLQKAVQNAYNNVSKISCESLIYRKDIAHQSL